MHRNYTISIRSAENGEELYKKIILDNSRIDYIAWSPNGDKIAFRLPKGIMGIFDSKLKYTMTNINIYNGYLAWSSDNNQIAMVGNKYISVFNSFTGDISHIIDVTDGSHRFKWSPNGKYFAYNDRDFGEFEGTIIILDAKTWKEITRIGGYSEEVDFSSFDFSSDGKRIFTMCENTIFIFDLFKDTDKDGHPNYDDEYPNDPKEWSDKDNDGIGDNADWFPSIKNQTTHKIAILMFLLIPISLNIFIYKKNQIWSKKPVLLSK